MCMACVLVLFLWNLPLALLIVQWHCLDHDFLWVQRLCYVTLPWLWKAVGDASAWFSLRIAGRTLENSCKKRRRNGWAAVRTRRSSSWSSSHEFCYGPLEHRVSLLRREKENRDKNKKEPPGASEVAQQVKEFALRFRRLSSIPRTHHMLEVVVWPPHACHGKCVSLCD